jgi:hypothetical protein
MPGLRPHHPQRSVRRCPPQDSVLGQPEIESLWLVAEDSEISEPMGRRLEVVAHSPVLRETAVLRSPDNGNLCHRSRAALTSALACRLSGWQLITGVLENR